METLQLIISKKDFDILKEHLKLSTNLSDFNKQKLEKELNEAKVLADAELPGDVVRLESVVKIESVDNNKTFTFQLVMPQEANMKKQKLSVFAPIGIALLGYQTGTIVEWEMPDGVKKFKIIDVKND
ncbi:GreA/GreB family elongation factor [Pseudopedobacter saltans DSM 12145]|uniref:GreA/GreB family elongation factor n=1 Tax=Pseudopedobacter saltans (strain ATCC 51119 / DSM 12145 / JCM 21818 / CCUG 39354 / LMG 10337 / NBRC 100064 / NCIMB 13643) TaxID=762903 RepID=F0S9G6_PSESL|nr:GreA/GreB family elongation factor [Pseudopedobacter saltans]ADY53519.1 GreA/GreB family elongation factor [Pseudopedobacter saltans DSM 12145]